MLVFNRFGQNLDIKCAACMLVLRSSLMARGGFQPASGFKLPDVNGAVKGNVARSSHFTEVSCGAIILYLICWRISWPTEWIPLGSIFCIECYWFMYFMAKACYYDPLDWPFNLLLAVGLPSCCPSWAWTRKTFKRCLVIKNSLQPLK